MDGNFSRQYDDRRREFSRDQRKREYRRSLTRQTGRERRTGTVNLEEEFDFEIELIDLSEDSDQVTGIGMSDREKPEKRQRKTTDALWRSKKEEYQESRAGEIKRAARQQEGEFRRRKESRRTVEPSVRTDRATEVRKASRRRGFAEETGKVSSHTNRTSYGPDFLDREPETEEGFFRLSHTGGKRTASGAVIVMGETSNKNRYQETVEAVSALAGSYGAAKLGYSAAAAIEITNYDTAAAVLEEPAARDETRRDEFRTGRNGVQGQKRLTREQWLKKRKQQVIFVRSLVALSATLLLFLAGSLVFQAVHRFRGLETDEVSEELAAQGEEERIRTRKVKVVEQAPDFSVQLLTVNEYSRPAIPTEKIENIVVHYTANPGTTAQQNRDFFESLKETHETSVSSHFVIGIDGEIIQCIPTKERAYASNNRNYNTVSIENCHIDKSGRFTQETYDSLVALSAWLCGKFKLNPDDIIRHYDVTGKVCPKYYVENEGAWALFIEDVRNYIEEYGVEKEIPVDDDDDPKKE